MVILEAELSLEERAWYIRAVRQYGWSKLELQRKIESMVHLENALDVVDNMCYTGGNNTTKEPPDHDKNPVRVPRQYLPQPHG